MKLKRHINFINESNSETKFTFRFIQDCEECKGTGYRDDEEECSWCRGAGFNKEYDENDMDYDVDCERCNGEGHKIVEDQECETCSEGHLVWNLEFEQDKGVINIFEDYGNSDQPIQYDDGRIGYNHPDIFPSEIKDIVRDIFDNKDLSVEDMANSIARFVIKEEYHNEFVMDGVMEDFFNDDTNRILSSTKNINKFDL